MYAISKTDDTRFVKQGSELELPKITKPSFQSNSYTLKYEWLARSSQYALLSTTEVQEEQAYLVSELAALKQQLKKCPVSTSRVSRVSSKPLHRSHQTNLSQNRQRQIQSNQFNIIKLRNQLQLLQRQASPRSSQGVEGKVMEAREKILKLKQKIKELKHRSRQMGDNLENGRDFFEQAKKLEHERDGLLARKNKLQQKVYQSEQNLSRMIQKLAEVEGDALYADSYLEDWHETKRNQQAERSIQNEYRQKSYQLQLVRKTMESHKSTKQQKYHQLLKNLQTEIQKTGYLETKLQKTEIKNLYQKKELMELEDQLQQIDLNRSRTKTSGSLEHFQDTREHQELPALHFKFNKIAPNKKNYSTSRTKTSGHPLDNKNNYTEILHKPPSSESDVYSMITQPPPRAYLRASRNRMIADRTAKTAMGAEKSVELITCIQEQITEQSPQKETIDKNLSLVKVKEPQKQQQKAIEQIQAQKNVTIDQNEGDGSKQVQCKQSKEEKNEQKFEENPQEIKDIQGEQEISPEKVVNEDEDEIIVEEVQKTIESNLQQQVEKARKSVCEAQAKMQHNQNVINNYLNRFETEPLSDQQS